MTRKRRSSRERERLLNLHDRRCYLCGQPIETGEAWELEHVVAWELTRDDSDENVRPCHSRCHKPKTAEDIRIIRKADRQRWKHLGIAKPKRRMGWPGLRRKLDGTVERTT